MLNRFAQLGWVLAVCVSFAHTVGAQTATERITLDAARTALNSPGPGKKIGDIDLTGFGFARELEIGAGIRVIAISTNDGGGLAAFRPDGSSIETLRTGKITWLQLFDLNEDNVSEIVTEEVNGRGTGVLQKSFNVYAVSAHRIKSVWHAESYSLDANSKEVNSHGSVKERIGYLRFDPSGFGRRARMAYLLTLPTGVVLTRGTYEMRGETVVKVSAKCARQ
jgi:hypothetical protein